ncbi:MAG: hypothetical protein RL045_1767 [Bacteroidota bacterium]
MQFLINWLQVKGESDEWRFKSTKNKAQSTKMAFKKGRSPF